MQADVERELSWSPYVANDSIDVEVAHGVVTLKGQVANSRERRAAVANAYQGGAVKVDDMLTFN
jgi:osmotically-inducible protein OsmY